MNSEIINILTRDFGGDLIFPKNFFRNLYYNVNIDFENSEEIDISNEINETTTFLESLIDKSNNQTNHEDLLKFKIGN